MTRAEHLAWCKKRALAELTVGTPANAWASMVSDMSKHDETRNNVALRVGTLMLMNSHLNTPATMKKFIEDFQ